jgi:hypothetical protein
VFCLSAPSGARLLLFVVCLVPRGLAFPDRSNAAKEANRTASANNLAEKRLSVQLEQRERFMKDILGTLMAALLVILSLITLLRAEHNWEPSNEPVLRNTERVSDLGLRLALKNH